MKLITKIFIFVFLVNIFIPPTIAKNTPKTIIIIRHGDKIKAEKCGPALSPKGIVRSMAFALFYIKDLNPKQGYPFPDYIFAVNPYQSSKRCSCESYRHLQTVAPLVTWMYNFRTGKTSTCLVNIPFRNTEYKKLTNLIYSDNADFKDKTILICWTHNNIPALINDLTKGFKIAKDSSDFPQKWDDDDYSSIIILNYSDNSIKIEKLNKEKTYPVPDKLESQMAIIKDYYNLFVR